IVDLASGLSSVHKMNNIVDLASGLSSDYEKLYRSGKYTDVLERNQTTKYFLLIRWYYAQEVPFSRITLRKVQRFKRTPLRLKICQPTFSKSCLGKSII